MYSEHTADVAPPIDARDLVAEANHRIANTLTLISATIRGQASSLPADGTTITAGQVRTMLGEIQSRITAAARLHRVLSASGGDAPVDVGAYLQRVVSEVVSTMSRPNTTALHFACQIGCRVPADRAFHIGLIVVELVVNSIKHAHPADVHGKLEVRCRRDPQNIVINVADDGVGLPEEFDPDSGGHAGMRLMHALAARMGAALAFESDALGLQCELSVPIAAVVSS